MRFNAHLRKDIRLILRDWRSFLLALALPVLIIFAYQTMDLGTISASGRNPDAFILALASAFPVLLGASRALVQERADGTLQRVTRSPADLIGLVVSKTLSATVVILPQVATLVLVSLLLLGHAWQAPVSSAGPLFLVLSVVALTSHAVGVFVSACVSTDAQAMQVVALALLLMVTLGGFLQPLGDLGLVGAIASWQPVAIGYATSSSVLTDGTAVDGGLSIADGMMRAAAVSMGALLMAGLVTRLRS